MSRQHADPTPAERYRRSIPALSGKDRIRIVGGDGDDIWSAAAGPGTAQSRTQQTIAVTTATFLAGCGGCGGCGCGG